MGDLAVATEMEKFLKVPIFSVSTFKKCNSYYSTVNPHTVCITLLPLEKLSFLRNAPVSCEHTCL